MTRGDIKRTKERPAGVAQAGMYFGVGIQFAVTIVLATMGGWWLDEKLSTSPLLLIAGMLFGATAAFYHLYKTLTRAETSDDGDRSPTSEPGETRDDGGMKE